MRIFYTDGSYGAENKKAGGWAIIETDESNILYEKYEADFNSDTNSEQMELRAAIEAAKMIKTTEVATINCDCEYVVKGITQWVITWQKNNWQTEKQEYIKNKELWQELFLVTKGKTIIWKWIRAHAGNYFNEKVNELSRQAYTNSIMSKKQILNAQTDCSLLEIGQMFHLGDESKKYMTVLHNIKISGKIGFLVKVMANHLGQELEFLEYRSTKAFKYETASVLEKKIVFNTVKTLFNKDAFYKMQKNCNHMIEDHDESAVCAICEQDFGWWCPDSPDHCCHYYSEAGKVKLINGLEATLSPNHNDKYETEDSCIFCEDPQERK